MKKKLAVLISVITLITAFYSFSILKNEQVESDIELFAAFYRTLNLHYVDSIHSDKLIRRIIDATTKLLDPYTTFYDAAQTKERENTWAGIQYVGIGATIQQFDSLVYITDLLDNYPAQLAGLKIGDAFIKINDTLVVGKDIATVRNKLVGESGTQVKVEVKRGNNILNFSLIRKQVISPAVDLAYVEKGIGYIRLNHFLKSASSTFKHQLDSLAAKEKIRHLIIDLRQNSGGIVEECVAVLSNFLPAKTEVCYLRGFHKDANYSYYTDNKTGDTLTPITLLISNQTVSAGEIFAGALQDLDRASVIGERSFGKGFVQGTRYPGMGTSLYVTAARYYTPSGRCIQEKKYANDVVTTTYLDTTKNYFTKKGKLVNANGGIEPDIVFKNDMPFSVSQIFSEKEVFFYLNNIFETYQNASDSLKFFKNEEKKLLSFLSSNLQLMQLPIDYEIKQLKEKLKENFSNDFCKSEMDLLQRKVNYQKKKLLFKHKDEILKEFKTQIVKRKYGKQQELFFRIKNDEILKQLVL